MYSYSVASVALDKDFTSSCCKAGDIPGISMHYYCSRIHGIACLVLTAAKNLYCRATHEHTQVITWCAVNIDFQIVVLHTVCNESLTKNIFHYYVFIAIISRAMYLFVEHPVSQRFFILVQCVDCYLLLGHHIHPQASPACFTSSISAILGFGPTYLSLSRLPIKLSTESMPIAPQISLSSSVHA